MKHRPRERARALRDPETIAREVRAIVDYSIKRLELLTSLPVFLDRIERLAAALATWGVRMNLTAEPEKPSEIAFHMVDSLAPLILASRDDGAFLSGTFSAGNRAARSTLAAVRAFPVSCSRPHPRRISPWLNRAASVRAFLPSPHRRWDCTMSRSKQRI